MTSFIVNSAESLQRAFGMLREDWEQYKFLRLSWKAGVDRSLPQNALTHAWYGQIARELREDDESGWKCFCKLHFGVPLLRAEDEEFRTFYDASIKALDYEQKLVAMKYVPVTSIMTRDQLSKYADEMQKHFASRGVLLESVQ